MAIQREDLVLFLEEKQGELTNLSNEKQRAFERIELEFGKNETKIQAEINILENLIVKCDRESEEL